MGGTSGHARRAQSGLGAAIMITVYEPHERRALAEELTGAFLDGRWRAEDLAERASGVLDRRPSWLDALAFATAALDRTAQPARRRELARFVDAFLSDLPAGSGDAEPPQMLRRIQPRAAGLVHEWPIAAIDSLATLAERLELSLGQLAWLADARGLERTVGREQLRNYRYAWVPRRGGLPRLIEAPKARLKEIQRWVLREILDPVPAHDAAHGFTRGRSVLTHAGLHTGQAAVLTLDLRDFFASVSAGRVFGIFHALGYEPSVAHALTGLCTNTTAQMAWNALGRTTRRELIGRHFELGRRLATPHLPQGAPSSPALANLAAFGLDRRLSRLAAAFGLRYSRYADDLTLSGPGLSGHRGRAVAESAATIARAEGFRLHPDKSRLRTAARRQTVTGVVVNVRPNVTRPEYDRLRATIHRLAVRGPGAVEVDPGVDLEAHLRGRAAWVAALNPARGEKLRRLLDAVEFDDAT